MQRVTLEAKTTATDQELGTFTAIVSAWEADREKDVVERHAFDATIRAWQASGKKLPLLFEHSTRSVGAIDPATMHPSDAGLVVSGEVDRETDEGRQVWRMVKQNTIGFSIGFMSKSKPREGGGRILTEIDLLEISATSTPMHPSARVISWKSSADWDPDEYWRSVFGGPNAPLSQASYEEYRHKDQELEKMIAEVEAEAERQRKRDRPIKVKRFKV
jgi:HK97 family phage prohead protease